MDDLYRTHFVLVDITNKKYLETCFKKYPQKFLHFRNNKYFLSDTIDQSYEKVDQLYDFKLDILKNIYQLYLKPLGHYKIMELKDIAKEMNISLVKGTKNKIKKED